MKDRKKSLELNGYTVFQKHFENSDLLAIERVLESICVNPRIDLYHDRSGLIRRAENFTFKYDFFISLNFKVVDLLSKVTGEEYILFKDKINFKPPGGEGFSPHYDGVFTFSDGIRVRNGWYEYAEKFINVLITLDDFTIENGALEVAKVHSGSFEELLRNTKQNGSPELREEVASGCSFSVLSLERGSVVIFSNLTPHRSAANKSNKSRVSLYLTYNPKSYGDNYHKYFVDKKSSMNAFKSLTGDRI
jgi:ectoine hydroxylase-related dioxygenase (phytanoyl-CoA dioxygenase family)